MKNSDLSRGCEGLSALEAPRRGTFCVRICIYVCIHICMCITFTGVVCVCLCQEWCDSTVVLAECLSALEDPLRGTFCMRVCVRVCV
jgi:hypothetical protein